MNTPASLQSWQRAAWKAAAGGLLVCLISGVFDRAAVLQAYWFAWIFWSGVSFGALLLLLLLYLTPGAWGTALRPHAEAGAMTLFPMAALLLPALCGMGSIFPWAPGSSPLAPASPHQHAFLQPGWLALRSLGYFAVLLTLLWQVRQARLQGATSRLRGLSVAGVLAYAACMLFASTDWVLSLEPGWYSTMFVVIFMTTHFLSALALLLLLALWPAGEEFDPLWTPKVLHDLGNLLLAFVVFWAYLSFSQFLIIWSGNLPCEIGWYVHRRSGGWELVSGSIAVVQFAVPLALLLSRAAKRHRHRLWPIALLVCGGTVVSVFWLVVPAFHPEQVRWPWRELAAFVSLGGCWLASFGYFFQPHAPEVKEVPHD